MNVVADSKDSILAVVAGIIAPVFLPLGFGNWKISTALITGFMAKESVVSTLSVLFGSTAELTGAITPVAAASLLVFCLLYTPCVAAIASIKRELGAKWAAYVVLGRMYGCVDRSIYRASDWYVGNVKRHKKPPVDGIRYVPFTGGFCCIY